MKLTIYAVIILHSILIISGCNGNKTANKLIPELEQAEKVMFDHPDSSLHILESMEIPSSLTDKENHALWCLLTSQAKVKQLMKISSDSLVRIAYDYYKPTNNARRKAMSALYMGNINYNLGHIEEAMKYYLEGKSEVEKTEDYKTGYLIMSSLGKLYLYRNLTDYALESCTKAYDYAGLKNTDYYYDIQHEIALVYTNSHKIEKSLSILQSFPIEYRPFSLIGKNYFRLGKLDSAFYYLNKALNTDNVYAKASIYEYLYRLSKNPKYNQYLKTYCDSLLFYNDSIIAMDKGKEIIAYKEKYNNEKLVTEKQKLELEKANITYWWMFTIVIVLLLGILLIYIYLRKRIAIQKKEEELTSLALQLHQKELEVEKNESYIVELQSQFEKNNKKEELYMVQVEELKNLKKENERLSLEKNLLYEKIASYSISSQELEKREKELCSLLLTQIPFLRQLHLKPVYLNDTELSDICQITDNIFHHFTQRLSKEISSLSEHEIILCCLIKLRFSITEIAVFLNIASTSVSRSKLRIKNKIYAELGEDSKEKSLDIWLWEY